MKENMTEENDPHDRFSHSILHLLFVLEGLALTMRSQLFGGRQS